MDELSKTPLSFLGKILGVRDFLIKFLLKKFPYGNVYSWNGEDLFILEVMQMKFDPDYWLGRIEDTRGISLSDQDTTKVY